MINKDNIQKDEFDSVTERNESVTERNEASQSVTKDDISHEINKIIESSSGNISSKDICHSLCITDKTGKTAVRMALCRLKEKGIIQPSGKNDGVFRKIEDRAEEIQWWKASDKKSELVLPLRVTDFCSIYPRNIICIAGEPNAGKTAFSLNVAALNAKTHEVDYYSSEMGDIELKTRLSKFESVDEETWRYVKFYERSTNFADVINPNRLTIIDFLEMNDEFWKIGVMIKEIYDKLKNGICIINIQKNKGRDIGRGGEMGLEKPRLYLAMGDNKIKIVKAKAWAQEGVNPKDLQLEYSLVQGCKFIEQSAWHKAEEETESKYRR